MITGASGFVGQALVSRLQGERKAVRLAYRSHQADTGGHARCLVGDIGPATDWQEALVGVDTVVHLAARVHVMQDTSTDPWAAFRKVNVEGTARLAQQAAAQGVKRLVFVSSIKVNGESTPVGCPYTADDKPAPEDAYGFSKWEAEQALWGIAQDTGLEVVVVRPPLVYGPGVKANFLAMMRWLDKGYPLPLGAVTQNRRSLVGLTNLVDLLVTCMDHPAAAGQVFLAADGEDVSTAGLLQCTAAALGRPCRLLPVPSLLLRAGAHLLGKRGVYHRLCGSLQLDIEKNKRLLGWVPPLTLEQGLRETAQGFRP